LRLAKPLPRVEAVVVVKALATEVFVAELDHSLYVKSPDFENSAHLERGRRVEGRLKQVKTNFTDVN